MQLQDAVNSGQMKVDLCDLAKYATWLVSIWQDKSGYTCCHMWDSTISPVEYYAPGRLFLGVDATVQVDHRNLDTLDNSRTNLRVATPSQNAQNRGKSTRNTSGYKGVSYRKRTGLYEVAIKVNGTPMFLGSVLDPAVGGRMYDEAAKKYFGEFANLNFPETV